MTSAVQDCVAAIRTIITNNITCTEYSEYPKDSQATGIWTTCFESSGRFEGRNWGWGQSFHAITCYIMGAKSNMEQVYKQLSGEMENICEDILADPTLGGKCDTLDNPSYEVTTVQLSGVDYTGYKLTVSEIKIQRTF